MVQKNKRGSPVVCIYLDRIENCHLKIERLLTDFPEVCLCEFAVHVSCITPIFSGGAPALYAAKSCSAATSVVPTWVETVQTCSSLLTVSESQICRSPIRNRPSSCTCQSCQRARRNRGHPAANNNLPVEFRRSHALVFEREATASSDAGRIAVAMASSSSLFSFRRTFYFMQRLSFRGFYQKACTK